MNLSFQDQLVVVTGASRGIGRAIAEAFGAAGATVACIATKASNAEETAAAITAAGGKASAYGLNVSDSAAVNALTDEIVAAHGAPSVLINNAGLTRDGLMMRMSDEDFQTVIDVNLRGAFNTIRAMSRPMMKARYGRIVNITSIVGLHGAAGQTNYAASKAGLVGLTYSVAKELGSRGITCNAIAPGFIETDMTKDLPAEFRESVSKNAPAGRLGSPVDIAAAAVFLASREAGYVTGQVLTVDGGLTI
ncbi:MAG: 3-oxoacyl-[acyl-carrier-protein] reductase [Chthonomonas sp.]|nr:3-oxoacyl-[acyl-carrier-protein] reductase [Chthonomonas sp.]